ncbi:uncharacterized protein LOC124301518 [Neodiprion virginianus]|uniref:uncharacterized protein LOC124301518 n=1 Tax=Neodiprion virginianus TaxID=2961670 RepID=UPI001EE745E7|nr:uncharacterized protein LOC124301518 [Neodiprion virginianus]
MGFKQVIVIATLAVSAVQVSSKDVKTLYTNGYYYSQFFPLESNMAAEKTLRFSVRAPRDAHILLAPSHQADGPVYEIVLGAHDNTVNYIRGRCPCQEEPSASIRTVNLLNRQQFRNFWIRIKSDSRRTFIQVGIGGKDTPFHEWRDPRPLNLQYLSFRSGTPAEWKYGYSDEANTVGVSADRHQSVVTSTGYGQYYPLSEVVSHSDDAVTLYFTVRTSKEFQILLSPAVSSLGDCYEFGISQRGAYLRRRHLGENKAAFKQDGFSNDRERARYWIRLTRDGSVTMGKGGSASPVIQWRDPSPLSPQFLSFTLHRERGEDPDASSFADVQFALGPDYSLATQDCRARWKDASGGLPPGAVRGGRNNDDEIFVCRASHDGEVAPGSYVPIKGRIGECHVTSSLFVYQKTEFQVLTGCRFGWLPASLGAVPDGAISGGESSGNVKLFVSRVSHEDQVIVGKLQPNRRLSFIPFGDQELPFTNYEVLVKPASANGASSAGGSNDSPLIGK